jgi:hypothetical protein
MAFRYRLIDAATGADLGPFLSKRDDCNQEIESGEAKVRRWSSPP